MVDENGLPALIGPPWEIVGRSELDGDSDPDILWHDSSTGEIQIWFMNRERRTARATVLGENGQPALIEPPWSIVATSNSPLDIKPDGNWFQIRAETKMHVGAQVSALAAFEGHVDLYATGPDGTVWTTFFQDHVWQPWGEVRPETTMHPGTAVSCSQASAGHVDLYATDSDGVVWTTFFQARRILVPALGPGASRSPDGARRAGHGTDPVRGPCPAPRGGPHGRRSAKRPGWPRARHFAVQSAVVGASGPLRQGK